MISFSRDRYGHSCCKCGQTSPLSVQYYRRPDSWNADVVSMTKWETEYSAQFATEHAPPETSDHEWLVVVCQCGYAYEMGTADR